METINTVITAVSIIICLVLIAYFYTLVCLETR